MPDVAFARWDPFRDLLALQEQIGQIVGTDAPGWTPPVDLYETSDGFVLIAELPGLNRDQIEILDAHPTSGPKHVASDTAETVDGNSGHVRHP